MNLYTFKDGRLFTGIVLRNFNPANLSNNWSFPVSFELGGSRYSVGRPFNFSVGLDHESPPDPRKDFLSMGYGRKGLLRADPKPFSFKIGDDENLETIPVVRMSAHTENDKNPILVYVFTDSKFKWTSDERWGPSGHLIRGFCHIEEGTVKCLMGDIVDRKENFWSGGLFILYPGSAISVHSSSEASYEDIWLICHDPEGLGHGPVASSLSEALALQEE